GDNIEEQRARAVVLSAHKGRKQRQKAVGLLEDIRTKQPLTAEEQFLLAQLYESVGDWGKSQQQMIQLLTAHSSQGRYLMHYSRSLLRRGETGEAEVWLEKLTRAVGSADNFALVELKARLFA